ncbi:hypothetical protein ACP4OV_011109 [Aristida adscensionis]
MPPPSPPPAPVALSAAGRPLRRLRPSAARPAALPTADSPLRPLRRLRPSPSRPAAACALRHRVPSPSPPPAALSAACARRQRAPPPSPPPAVPSTPASSMAGAALPTAFLHARRRPPHRLLSLQPHCALLFVVCVLAGRVTGGDEDVIVARIAAGGGSRTDEIPRIWADLDALCGIGEDFHGDLDGGGESQVETQPLGGGGGMGLRPVSGRMPTGSGVDRDRRLPSSRPVPVRPSSILSEAHCGDAQMRPASQLRGREQRRGWWWQRAAGRFVEEGVDFVQDTEGGAEEIVFIPDSDDGSGVDGSAADPFAGEFVPETEPQDLPELLLVKHDVGDGDVHADNEPGDMLVKGEADVVASEECDHFKEANAIIDHEVNPNEEEEDDLFKDGDFRGDSEVQDFEDFTLEWEYTCSSLNWVRQLLYIKLHVNFFGVHTIIMHLMFQISSHAILNICIRASSKLRSKGKKFSWPPPCSSSKNVEIKRSAISTACYFNVSFMDRRSSVFVIRMCLIEIR